MEIKEIDTRKSRLIFDARMARKLLKMGFVVIDIKPNRENTDKSIFVFENTEEFKQALATVKEEMRPEPQEEQLIEEN
jgi:hypothetical protein